MTWINFDWLKYESEQFEESLNRRVREAYRAAHSVLEKAHGETKEKLKAELKETTDEDSAYTTAQLIDYEELLWVEQEEALAAMALTLVASQTESFLDELKHSFDKTRPPTGQKYTGSKLMKRIAEYRDRFNIDLEKIDGFETGREAVLARNCCVHSESVPDEDYKTKTKQRLLNSRKNICLTPDSLDMIIGELSKFGKSLAVSLREVSNKARDASAPS